MIRTVCKIHFLAGRRPPAPSGGGDGRRGGVFPKAPPATPLNADGGGWKGVASSRSTPSDNNRVGTTRAKKRKVVDVVALEMTRFSSLLFSRESDGSEGGQRVARMPSRDVREGGSGSGRGSRGQRCSQALQYTPPPLLPPRPLPTENTKKQKLLGARAPIRHP